MAVSVFHVPHAIDDPGNHYASATRRARTRRDRNLAQFTRALCDEGGLPGTGMRMEGSVW